MGERVVVSVAAESRWGGGDEGGGVSAVVADEDGGGGAWRDGCGVAGGVVAARVVRVEVGDGVVVGMEMKVAVGGW
ncbi:hypothetical protein Tco_1169810 [Tanacetum coccineum]